jgi:serine/threonine protein kinase
VTTGPNDEDRTAPVEESAAHRSSPAALPPTSRRVRVPVARGSVPSLYGLNDAPPSTAHLYEAPPPPSTLGTPLLFVCDACWRTFGDGSLPACACERPRPVEGWAHMPYLFRGRYLFVELLGRGGMGAVFRAYDRASKDRPWVAVKVVQQGTPELLATLKEMFRREVAAAQMLAQHEQFFVGVLGHDLVDPAYLALEYVPWQTLRELFDGLPAIERRLSPAQVARIGIAILRGVSKMHFHRIVHRDLTPSNVFVRPAPEGEGYGVKITDLGLWAFDQVQGESDSLSLVGMPGTAGTPAYMSPEQSTGEVVGAASDVHAIGSMLWELATGSVPFPVHGELTVHEQIEGRVKLLREVPARPPTMPEGLYRVLARALCFDPAERWASALEMRRALEAFVEHYQGERQRDLVSAMTRIEALGRRVASLRDKLTPMREVLERLRFLNAVLTEAREQRDEADPEALRAIADNAARQLDQIGRELGALSAWLGVLGAPQQRSDDKGEGNPPSINAGRAGGVRGDRRAWVALGLGSVLLLLVLALGFRGLLSTPTPRAEAPVPSVLPLATGGVAAVPSVEASARPNQPGRAAPAMAAPTAPQ